jgi:beta-lactamase regulating signal transducer with metallopeptidase domain
MNAMLNRLGSELVSSFGQLSIELTALAILILLASRLLPIQTSALRHFMCIAILLKPIIALTISSLWTLFTSIVSLLEPIWSSLGHSLSSLRAESVVAREVSPLIAEIRTVSLTRFGWLAALWVAGAALFLGRILIGHTVVWRLRWQAHIQRAGALFDALQQARQVLDVNACIQVATSNAVRSPVVLGIFEPLVVVPAYFVDKLRRDELELILLHELAHVRRYDNLILLLQRLLAVALFFTPSYGSAVICCGVKPNKLATTS